MKELSIEEKAKAYDKVFKEVKDFFEGRQKMYNDVTQTLKYLFPELKIDESEDERIRKAIKLMYSFLPNEPTYIGDVPVKDIFAWLEKQGEKKPADKVEPKFKVGDWVVTSYGKVNQIVSVDKDDDDGYTLDDGTYFSGSWCYMFHLWTIQDAKDGDVLSYRNGQWIFIFKKDRKEHEIAYHALISDKGFSVNDVAFTVLEDSVAPATKEQRDTLMKAMADAGYTFDFEKKELKKIEQNPVEPQQDMLSQEQYAKAVDECVFGEQKPAWSEEDEKIRSSIINFIRYELNHSAYIGTAGVDSARQIEWLKSLSPQNTWKPSDKQMEALKMAIDIQIEEYGFSSLNTLFEQLKSL